VVVVVSGRRAPSGTHNLIKKQSFGLSFFGEAALNGYTVRLTAKSQNALRSLEPSLWRLGSVAVAHINQLGMILVRASLILSIRSMLVRSA